MMFIGFCAIADTFSERTNMNKKSLWFIVIRKLDNMEMLCGFASFAALRETLKFSFTQRNTLSIAKAQSFCWLFQHERSLLHISRIPSNKNMKLAGLIYELQLIVI